MKNYQHYINAQEEEYGILSYEVRSGSDITPCNKINKPLVVYRFWQYYEMTPIIMLHIYGKILKFSHQKCNFKVMLMSYDKQKLTFMLLFY